MQFIELVILASFLILFITLATIGVGNIYILSSGFILFIIYLIFSDNKNNLDRQNSNLLTNRLYFLMQAVFLCLNSNQPPHKLYTYTANPHNQPIFACFRLANTNPPKLTSINSSYVYGYFRHITTTNLNPANQMLINS